MSDNAAILDAIKQRVNANPVMLFMKGTPDFPQCGFSSTVAQILNYLDVEYASENVLASDELRQGIKEFSDWPTIPQLYVKGEFVGGCDIIREMFESGELREFLTDKGIEVAGAGVMMHPSGIDRGTLEAPTNPVRPYNPK